MSGGRGAVTQATVDVPVSPRVSLVVPTYNERDTLPGLLRQIGAIAGPLEVEVVVVDDASPDGTAEAAEALDGVAGIHVRVVRRPGKRGLASAILDGAAVAAGPVLVVMDGDGSHPPMLIPALARAVQEGADVAVASRYRPGGAIERWPLWRRAVSTAATAAARAILRLPVRDPLSGFFALRREILTRRDHWGIGFKLLLEVLARHPELRVVEVPYTFVDRREGRSKLGWREVAAYIRLLAALLRERTVSRERR